MITGQEKPDSGTIEIGETVQLGYVDQSRDALDPTRPSGRKSPAATTS
jgi:ATPase subunit of ABC transporter with duplicated ATPase domains